MHYISDNFEFGTIILSGAQHRRLAEIHEELIVIGGDAFAFAQEIRLIMADASLQPGNENCDLKRDAQ